MKPSDSDIYCKSNLDKRAEVLLKATYTDTLNFFSNEEYDSILSSNMVIFNILCSNMETFTLSIKKFDVDFFTIY